jgi:hypothetical protein
MTAAAKKQRFQVRESPLTIALRDPNHRATMSFFFAGELIILIGRCLNYIFDPGLLKKDFNLFARYFTNVHIMFLMEGICLMTFVLILLPSTMLWTRGKINRLFHSLLVLVTAVIVNAVPPVLANMFHLHPLLRAATAFQQIRYGMKLISFVTENKRPNDSKCEKNYTEIQEDSNNNNNNNDGGKKVMTEGESIQDESSGPSLNSLVYFMFAPTLIYQHSYPRSEGPIRWGYILKTFLMGIAPAPIGLIVCRKLIESSEMIGLQETTPADLITLWYWSVAMAVMNVVAMGFFFFHCYSNCWAEVLRFGDRQFYKNWWSAPNPLAWMSLWNMVVQSWIAEYIYKPLVKLCKSRFLAINITFLLSGIGHDYVFTFIVGFFVPGCLTLVPVIVLSGPIVFLIVKIAPLLPLPETNVTTFVCYMIAMSLAFFFPMLEFMSRVNCPPDPSYDSLTDFFVLRFPTCVKLKL